MSLPYVQDNLSFAIFHDAGNVFATPGDMRRALFRWHQNKRGCTLNPKDVCDFNYVSHAIGAGIRYRTPIGPVRFDFGYNLNPPVFPVRQPQGDQLLPFPHIETGRRFNFFFSIGQTF